ncbi:MAG TPA: pyridoxal phosphate-dependent aminotransferase family protein [Bdellovibrionales bacterium]|nr:pyridoxal phosphate-dependent aminotransferase family protein [Bdellovibrionales bacterium]
MDLFAKIKGLELVDMLKQTGMYPFFRKLQGSKGNNVVVGGRDLVMMGSNNYLGLTHDPRVIEAAVESVRKWGVGCTGSRFLNGNLELHEILESELASFFGTEAALVFATGFMANSGAISALVGPGDYILSDKENHACIIEGCMLTKANFVIYRHADMEHLEKRLKAIPLEAGKLIITDGVFSMTGHLAPYKEIHELAKKYNARTYVDDAHGLGVVGPGGRGTAAHFGLPTDVLMGTFSKSLASQGGFICADKLVIDWLRHRARTFIFSAALAPASAAAALAALRILKEEPQRVDQVRSNATYLKKAFDEAGLNTMGTETCVVPVFIGDDETAFGVCQELLKMGVFTTPVVYPAVRKGQAMIRCSVMATHTKEDLDTAIKAFTALAPVIKRANENPNRRALADVLNGRPTQTAGSAEVPVDSSTELQVQ